MIEKDEISTVLQFISEYWEKLKNDPDNESLKMLPSKFWMKSIGGPVGNKQQGVKGRWDQNVKPEEMLGPGNHNDDDPEDKS